MALKIVNNKNVVTIFFMYRTNVLIASPADCAKTLHVKNTIFPHPILFSKIIIACLCRFIFYALNRASKFCLVYKAFIKPFFSA
jgi:hypothetical protein